MHGGGKERDVFPVNHLLGLPGNLLDRKQVRSEYNSQVTPTHLVTAPVGGHNVQMMEEEG